MARDRRSPSYSPPPQLLQSRRRSPPYSPPRGHRGGRSHRSPPPREYRSPHRHFPKRSNSRSPKPRRWKRDRSSSKEASPKRSRRAVSPAGPQMRTFDFAADDAEARFTFCCKHCDVKLHDLVSIDSHLKGKPHLMQQQRLRDNQLRIATGFGIKARHPPDLDQVEYDGGFWQREKGPRNLKPEKERWLDEDRLDKIEPKFQGDSYDQGPFNFRPESFHCDVCGVWVRSRDQMQAHKEGNKHQKKSNKVVRHHCNICLIDVTCRDTLENHKKGRDHIKRAQQVAEQKRRMGQRSSMDDDELEAVQDGKSGEEYRKEVTDLKRQLKILQDKVKELQAYKKFCLDTHENKEFKELLEHKRQCIENHQRPIELQKPGIHCKQEKDPIPHEPSSRRGVKTEKRRSYHESDEDGDRKKGVKSERRSDDCGRDVKSEEGGRRMEDGGREVKSERRSNDGGRGSFKSERRSDEGSWHTQSNESRGGTIEYIENEVDNNLKVENEHASDKEEYVENESNLKSEGNVDEDIILVE